MAVSTKTSESWLDALPASSLRNLHDDNTLRISAGLRLGSRLVSPPMPMWTSGRQERASRSKLFEERGTLQ
ncbi:hypothetical protein RvY_19117 [Ramazzottius varieornatus]|uniref:Uncharacterized protein n=1 Tax=Ramazzottius varieornatus TaxID=947166 RepID=A0A1D1W8A6_RAMVA|nr:hypothetical protein RvY_19117 [Ramazzottius varieornatus]